MTKVVETGASSADRSLLNAAIRTLRIEAEAVDQLGRDLPEDFLPALHAIYASKGQVIVAGVGKSGHVGRKLAATLASTGTPALFVHPTEASHGDLGMIGSQDIVILISNSGETAELGDILMYCQRFSIPLVGISCDPASTLMRAADYRLTLPQAPEACPMGMAPTTSTTVTLALGDAISVALMEMRGFTRETYATFHPGGKLGAQLARVEKLMHTGQRVPVVAAEAPMSEVLIMMTSGGFGIAAVVDAEARLAGIITDGDLRRHMEGLMEHNAGDIASLDPVTVAPDVLAAEALALLQERKISALLVTDTEQRPIGILHIHDLLRAGVV